MAATSMPEISSVYSRIKADYQNTRFVKGGGFKWSIATRTITHPPLKTLDDLRQLLHELSHAELNHAAYTKDIELIDMERQAWRYAVDALASRYNVPLSIDDTIVQDTLDSYRQWLHERSTCPNCQAVGRETTTSHYLCLSCNQTWRVNEAKTCRLKRSKT